MSDTASTPSFNLVDEPWIPCIQSAHAPPILLSLRQIFAQAPHLWQIADPSPVVTISLHRLLLAILHRSLHGPRNAREWSAIYNQGAWNVQAIDAYLTAWHSRFDLFDVRHPFFQTPQLPVNKHTGFASLLSYDRASGRNQPLLFDHTTSQRAWLTPAAAARALLAQQNFAVGGLIGYDSAQEPIANKYVGMAPLLGAAVCLVRGASLFETLMLNWVHYSQSDGQPFAFHGEDLPAWERDAPTAPVERIPDGYVDLLTWQSRRVLLIPATLPGGEIIVERAAFMKGYQFSSSFERWAAETMVTFRKSARANTDGGQPWYALGFKSDRVIWRDSQALFQSVEDSHDRPKIFDWLGSLMLQGHLNERRTLPLDVYGMIPDQANIEDWRRDSLPLPLSVLTNDALLEVIAQAVALAETVSRLLSAGAVNLTNNGKPLTTGSPMTVLAEALLVGTSSRSPDRNARDDLVNSFNAPLRYWAQLDTPFRQFVVALPHDVATDAFELRHYGQIAIQEWSRQVESAARQVFQQITGDLDTSARALRAVALAQSRFSFCLTTLLAPWRPTPPTSASPAVAAITSTAPTVSLSGDIQP